MQNEWNTLVQCDEVIGDSAAESSWEISALRLLIIADISCSGLGFISENENHWMRVVYNALNGGWIDRRELTNQDALDWFKGINSIKDKTIEPDELNEIVSACILVPPEIVCVQPKTRTPSVGCTLRSLTHHLALLPPKGQVKVKWHTSWTHGSDHSGSFNILFAPIPYEISSNDFLLTSRTSENTGYFDIEQSWLKLENNQSSYTDHKVVNDIIDLVSKGLNSVKKIDMVLLPELALNEPCYTALIKRLQSEFKDMIQVVVAGIREQTAKVVKNLARTTLIQGNEQLDCFQKKHHRWKLDEKQIIAYSLGDALHPQKDWWEDIDIQDREVQFMQFREGACFTTLVCEDLARIDPCQSVIRAIGPNLVFALLMDGPQIKGRWPERYAMSLGDDPGCSVLSVTSLALISRSNNYYNASSRKVALWQDVVNGIREIELPLGSNALLLNLSSDRREEFTLDGRSDGKSAVLWKLTGVIPISA